MNETTQFRDSVIDALDALMANIGYRRNKRSQSWTHKLSRTQSIGMHLNFGMRELAAYVSIIPSLWLRDERIVKLEVESGIRSPKYAADGAQFGRTIKSLGGRNFDCSTEQNPLEVAQSVFDDFRVYGAPYLMRLTDVEFVLQNLKSDVVEDWPASSRSRRARLLPLLLVVEQRAAEACTIISELEKDLTGKDQMIPDFSHFLLWFRGNFCH